ncbi:MAG: Smr/MutS family protein [Verrucomicrobiota bacterium]
MNPLPESAGPPVDPIRIEVSGDLDLHTYRPRDLPDLLPAWFEECRARGILTVRVIHGKGSGSLRAGVHALLPRLTEHVVSWTHPAAGASGGWGATIVQLKP